MQEPEKLLCAAAIALPAVAGAMEVPTEHRAERSKQRALLSIWVKLEVREGGTNPGDRLFVYGSFLIQRQPFFLGKLSVSWG